MQYPNPDLLAHYINDWNRLREICAQARDAGKRVVFVAGTGHLIHGGGVAESVRERVPGASGLVVFPSAGLPTEPDTADLHWILP